MDEMQLAQRSSAGGKRSDKAGVVFNSGQTSGFAQERQGECTKTGADFQQGIIRLRADGGNKTVNDVLVA